MIALDEVALAYRLDGAAGRVSAVSENFETNISEPPLNVVSYAPDVHG